VSAYSRVHLSCFQLVSVNSCLPSRIRIQRHCVTHDLPIPPSFQPPRNSCHCHTYTVWLQCCSLLAPFSRLSCQRQSNSISLPGLPSFSNWTLARLRPPISSDSTFRVQIATSRPLLRNTVFHLAFSLVMLSIWTF
jgi:hypothetical protein